METRSSAQTNQISQTNAILELSGVQKAQNLPISHFQPQKDHIRQWLFRYEYACSTFGIPTSIMISSFHMYVPDHIGSWISNLPPKKRIRLGNTKINIYTKIWSTRRCGAKITIMQLKRTYQGKQSIRDYATIFEHLVHSFPEPPSNLILKSIYQWIISSRIKNNSYSHNSRSIIGRNN